MSTLRDIAVVLLAVFVWQVYQNNYPRTREQPRFAGFFHPSFRKVAEIFRNNIQSGKERGASFSAYHNGEVLVDIWGGWADHDIERHWQEDTLSICFSSTKGMVALAMAKLVDMGVLDYKKELYHYWPEFASDEKKNITVEMLLSHQAGLIGLDEPITLFEYKNNWSKVENLLSRQKPKWPPGTGVGYHSMSGGMYADALMRKVDPKHRNMSQFFQVEIAEPLALDFHIGLPKELYHRFSRVKEASIWEMRLSFSEIIPFVFNPFIAVVNCLAEFQEPKKMNNPDFLAVGMPSVVGVGTARSLAKVYDLLANNGSVKGKKLLSQNLVQTLRTPLTQNLTDHFMGKDPFSQGFRLRQHRQGHEMLGFPGFGGTNTFADATIGVGMAYVTNYLSLYLRDDPREVSLRDAFYECFEKFKTHEGAKLSM